jgi:hypothetical protein
MAGLGPATHVCAASTSAKPARAGPNPESTAKTSPATISTRSPALQAATFVRSAFNAAASDSIKHAEAAPRESASNPSAPVPAKASSTTASWITARPPQSACISISNKACRTRSAVGRVPCPAGATSTRPRQSPATIRMLAVACRHRRRPGIRRQLIAQHP